MQIVSALYSNTMTQMLAQQFYAYFLSFPSVNLIPVSQLCNRGLRLLPYFSIGVGCAPPTPNNAERPRLLDTNKPPKPT